MSNPKKIVAFLGAGMCQAEDGSVIYGNPQTIYSIDKTQIDTPFSSWNPLVDLTTKHKKTLPSNIETEESPPYALQIYWHYIELRSNGIYTYSFVPQFPNGGDGELKCYGLSIYNGISTWYAGSYGLFAKIFAKSTLADFCNLTNAPFPPFEYYTYTLGSTTYDKETWSDPYIQELPDQHFDGPLDDYWFDYGPITSKFWYMRPRPAHNTNLGFSQNETGMFLSAYEWVFEVDENSDNISIGDKEQWHIDYPPPEIVEPYPELGTISNYTIIGTYTYTETWSVFNRVVNGKTEHVFRIDFESPTHLKIKSIDGLHDLDRPYVGYHEFVSDVPINIDILTEIAVLNQEGEYETEYNFISMNTEDINDSIIFTIQYSVAKWWKFYINQGHFYDWLEQSEFIDYVYTFSVIDEPNIVFRSRYIGVRIDNFPENLFGSTFQYNLVGISYNTKSDVTLVPAQIDSVTGERLIFSDGDFAVIIWDINPYYAYNGMRSTFMSYSGWDKEMHPDSFDDVRVGLIQETPIFEGPIYNEDLGLIHGKFFHLFPPTPQWWLECSPKYDEFGEWLTDTDGSYAIEPRGSFVVEICTNYTEYSKDVCPGIGVYTGSEVVNSFDGTLHISEEGTIRASRGTVNKDADDDDFDIVINMNDNDVALNFKVANGSTIENDFYYTGNCDIMNYTASLNVNGVITAHNHHWTRGGRAHLRIYPNPSVYLHTNNGP